VRNRLGGPLYLLRASQLLRRHVAVVIRIDRLRQLFDQGPFVHFERTSLELLLILVCQYQLARKQIPPQQVEGRVAAAVDLFEARPIPRTALRYEQAPHLHLYFR
jgi:hypothetical protein